jgi:hypothetical protein
VTGGQTLRRSEMELAEGLKTEASLLLRLSFPVAKLRVAEGSDVGLVAPAFHGAVEGMTRAVRPGTLCLEVCHGIEPAPGELSDNRQWFG